jgi:hypothetical protein
MKKILLFLTIFTIALTACNRDSYNYDPVEAEIAAHQAKVAAYKKAFTDKFGTISPTQTWGFKNMTTRGVYPNSNMWEDDGYVVPSPITEDELTKVLERFQTVGEEQYESLIDWDCFFVQQVYKGHTNTTGSLSAAEYTKANTGAVIGSDHMNELTVGYDEQHVNDFNNGTGGPADDGGNPLDLPARVCKTRGGGRG